jgi:hypothetical protein
MGPPMHVTVRFGPVAVGLAFALVLANAAYASSPQNAPSAAPVASATPSPSATPMPSTTASPSEFPSPSPSVTAAPAASSTPSGAPPGTLRLTRSAVSVSPGQIVAIGVDGASGTVTVQTSGPAIGVRYDTASSSLIVTGTSLGSATATVSDAAGDIATLAVDVLPAAGLVPAEVTVSLGGTVSPQFALAKIDAAIARLALAQPGGTLAVRGVTIADSLHPGDELEAIARVTIAAGSGFADQFGTTAVHLHVETLDQLEPAFLFYSDDPERLGSDGDGVLYRGTIDADKPARVYAYHVSDTPDRRLYLALVASGAPARVQLLGYAAGPADAFAYVGHVSTLQYLLERSTQESAIVDVIGDAPYVQQLGYRALGPGELVAAIFDLRVVSGGPVTVEVVAASGADDPLKPLGEPEHVGDGHGRRGEFALSTVPPFALTYASGDPEPEPLTIGDPTIPNLRPGGRPLGGDYGALRNVALQLSNPGSTPQNVYLYEQAQGGSATTTIWFTGDPRPTEIPCVRLSDSRYLVKAFALDAGESRAVTGEYMTDGSSSFPLDFGLTTAAPSPPPGPYSPNACNPKTPPATPSPSPSSSAPAPTSPSESPSASASPQAPAAAPSSSP